MYMNVEVTILIDNKVINLRPQGLKAEWGFSALIKAKETILFDAGQTEIAFENYTLLGCENPTKVVLSPGPSAAPARRSPALPPSMGRQQ